VTLAAASCEFISGIIHDDPVIAKCGKKKLYKSEVESFLPKDLDKSDRQTLTLQYANTWALELLFQDVANQQLSKEDLDVSRELEDYRRSLLKFRYEQRYVSDRLDTLVTDIEIESYFSANKDRFILKAPIVRARFLDIMQESPNVEIMKKYMSSEDEYSASMADSIAAISAVRYDDKSSEWTDAEAFARYFDLDYGSLLARMRMDGFIEDYTDKGDIRIGFICEMIAAGNYPPVEYCSGRIRDIIINTRKHELLTTLERDLLNDALDNELLIIY